MDIVKRFKKYATAFEMTLLDDNWSRLEPFFTEDAVYEGNPNAEGREAVVAKLKRGVDTLDRKMDSRTPWFQEPLIKSNKLKMKWTVTYTKEGLPDLILSGIEKAVFEGDQIKLLRDDLDPEARENLNSWMESYGESLDQQ